MKYALLGKTGLPISRLALGSWTFGGGPDRFSAVQRVNEQSVANSMVALALDAGINLFNSADLYSGAEEMLGRALAARRSEALIVTKGGMRSRSARSLLDAGLSRRHIVAAVEGSLRRLGTDYIDVYVAHFPDRYAPLEEMLEAFERIVRDGKVRYTGLSNFPAWMMATALGWQECQRYSRLVLAEMYYSLVCRDIESELVPLAQYRELGILAWSPLAGGLLSGRYTSTDPSGGGGRLSQFNLMPVKPRRAAEVLRALEEVSGATGATQAQIALAWILTRPFVSSVLVGASTEAQLRENIHAANLTLDSAHVAQLDTESEKPISYPSTFVGSMHEMDDPVSRALRGTSESPKP